MAKKINRHSGIAGWVKWAIEDKHLVYIIVAALVVFGGVGLFRMNKDEFPTFELTQGLVAGVYPGASAEEVEQQLTKPLEETIFSFKEVNRELTKSVTRDGICYIYVELNCSQSRKDLVWSKIKLGLQTRKLTLPAGVLAVTVLDDFSAVSALLLSMESSDKSYTELQDYADELCERLRSIPELASVSVVGSQEEEIAVTLDREKLSTYGIDPTMLLLNYETSTLSVPAGTFSTEYADAPLRVGRTVSGEREVAEKIVYTDPSGNVLRLKDVASVERRLSHPEQYVSHNGRSCLIINVEMRPDNNIVAFGKEVDKVMAEYASTLPDSVVLNKVSDQPRVVATSVFSFVRDLLISMLVVILVMVMMFPMRSALIASSGVPVCTAIALAIMYFVGMDVNTVTLAALIVVLGMIVDDSIITMDGYMDKLSRGYGRVDAACASAKELFFPTFVATAAICAMFFPMKGIITGYLGDFVKMFPWVITIALMISLVYAVTVVPSLEVRFISPVAENAKKNFIARAQDRFFDFIQRIYEKAQSLAFRFPKTTVLCGGAAVALGLFMFSRINIQMMPMAARDYFVVEMEVENGRETDVTRHYVDSLTGLMLSDSRVRSVTSFVGTGAPRFCATYAPKLPSPSFSQMLVHTESTKATEAILKEYGKKYEHVFPGVLIRFKQMDYQAVESQIAIDIKGRNREDLLEPADRIKAFLYTMDDDLTWVHSNCDNYISSVRVDLDPDEASRLGVNRALLALSLSGTYDGQTVATVWEGDNAVPVKIYSAGNMATAPYESIGDRMVATTVPGLSVPLRQVASLNPDWQLSELDRAEGIPSVTVSADMRCGKSQPAAMKKIKAFIHDELEPSLPEGVSIEYGGLSSMNKDVMPEIMLSFLAAVSVLFIFLLFHFKKASLAFLTLTLSTLCLFGAFFGLWVFQLDFTMTAVLGLISLVGIIVRNGILMFEYAEDQRFKCGVDVKTASMEAGKRRMRPIFLTSCTTALGVLPMIISGDNLWMPMGVVICFGTLLSIFLIVLIMPVSYWLLFRNAKPPKAPLAVAEAAPAANAARRQSLMVMLVALLPLTSAYAQQNPAEGASSLHPGVVPSHEGDRTLLSLDDCIRMASVNDPYLRNSRLDVDAAKFQKQEAVAEYFPTMSINAIGFHALDPLLRLGLDDVLGHSDAANELKNQIYQTAPLYGIPTSFSALSRGYGAVISLSQPLYAGGRIVNGNRLAQLGIEASNLQLRLQTRQTEAQIEEKYWQVVSLEEKRRTIDMAIETLDTLCKDVASAREAGILTETEVLQVQLERNKLLSDRVRLRGGLRLAKMDLFNSIGQEYSSTLAGAYDDDGNRLPFIDDICLDSQIDELLDPGMYHRSEEELAAESEESQLLALGVESKKLQKKMAVGEALPTVGIGASYGYGDYVGAPGLNGMVYAMVKVPVTGWGKTSRKIRRSDIEIEKALNEQEYLDRQLVLRSRQRWEEVVTAWDRVQIGEESVGLAQSGLRHMTAGLEAGMNTVSELLQAQTALRQAEDQLIDDRIAYVKAVREYLR